MATLSACVQTTVGAQTCSVVDEVVLRSLEEQQRLAELYGDVPALEALWLPTLVVELPDGTVLTDRAQVMRTLTATADHLQSLTTDIDSVQYAGESAAQVTGRRIATYAAGAGDPTSSAFVDTWVRSGASWQLSSRTYRAD
ncbi:MAG: nuclear transport factor 2 family protein [Gammaproteobacteria bacterium]|nr:nuclear transport factor 2 family protein [Gammaproteobacteria bacterium]